MKYEIDIKERILHFKQPAGTSRGVYLTRRSWFLTLTSEDGRRGVGECAPLPNLSCDDIEDYEQVLRRLCTVFVNRASEQETASPRSILEGMNDLLRPYPSMRFGLETAVLHWMKGSTVLFDTSFGRGERGIPINGLVWMGSYEEMMCRMEEKMKVGFRCIKLKIGAIDFERELDLIRCIREHFSCEQIEIRVDANGGFQPDDALEKLERLAFYDLHSIEQPIRQKQWNEMARLCKESPLPIALDEELIGVNIRGMKEMLLDTIRPQYIILKPSLHGGMAGSREWMDLARQRGIGYWITSALESNIGLNAIAHFTAREALLRGMETEREMMPQGLGTGMLFTDNIPMPLEVRGDRLWYLTKD